MKKETEICFLIDFAFIFAIVITLVITSKFITLFIPFICAFILAAVFIKLSRVVEKRLPVKSKCAAVISAVFFYLLVSAVLWLIITGIFEEILQFSGHIPDFFEETVPQLINMASSLEDRLFSYKDSKRALLNDEIKSMISGSLKELASEVSQMLLNFAAGFFKNLPVFLAGFIFTILSSFYIAVDFNNIKSFFKKVIPEDFHFFINGIQKFFKDVILKIAKAYLILMSITFIELSLGFKLLNIENIFRTAAITSLLDILPLFGTGCVLLPWALFSFIKEKSYLGWGLILLWIIITVIRNILEPHLIGKELGLSPLLSLAACFIGLKIMGLKGMILFPVGFLTVKYMFSEDKA